MKIIIGSAILCTVLCSCAQVQRDGARTAENANSIVTSAGQHVWTAPEKSAGEKEKEKEKLEGRAPTAASR